MPRLRTEADLHALINKTRPDAALDSADAVDNLLAEFDQPTFFADCFRGSVGRDQFIHHGQSRQFECIVFVSFTFGVFEEPRLFVGTANNQLKVELLAMVADPTTRTASLHNEQGREGRF